MKFHKETKSYTVELLQDEKVTQNCPAQVDFFFSTKCSIQIPITTVLLKGIFLPLLTKCSISIHLTSSL